LHNHENNDILGANCTPKGYWPLPETLEFKNKHPMIYAIVLSFITAFTLTYFAIPSIIHIAKRKNLCDEPGERRSHTVSTPSLGGIGIFAGVIFSIILWTPFNVFGSLQYILCSFIIIFLIGAKDDIIPTSPTKKLVAQILAAAILVFKADVEITSLYGIMGVYELPSFVSSILSIFTILVIVNAFNLIDGINGLSGMIGTLISLTFGTWFLLNAELKLAIVGFAMAGGIIAFLRYNITPAKIFMGDTGALLIGLACSILALEFIELNALLESSAPYFINAAPAVAIGILIIPLYDTARVFITRAMRGRSPFYPDRTHIHHLLIDTGLTHMQATLTLFGVNIFFIVLVYLLQDIGTINLLLVVVGSATLLSGWLYFNRVRKRQEQDKQAQALNKTAA
jgi:UDP-GlcNAc:undecaprenyl-phosphate GlcNAc-1-phosphate transferase